LSRKLLLLNLVQVALIALCAFELRQNWQQARDREQRMFGRQFKSLPAPILTPFPIAAPVTAGSYLDVADKVLLSKDRNPVVIVDKPAPKIMPPLPSFHGLMDLGAGPTIVLSEKPESAHRGYHLGESIGPFKIVSVDNNEIEFEWDGKPVRRRLDELVSRATVAEAKVAPAAVSPPPSNTPATTTLGGSTTIAGNVKGAPAPGAEGKLRRCVDGDDSPSGTVTDGYKKIINDTPFGRICRWEPLNPKD
jgi:hypothetical protein